jgi:hypothetical protein
VLAASRPLGITLDGVPITDATPLIAGSAAPPDPHDAPEPEMDHLWPGNTEALQFIWANAKVENAVRNADGDLVRKCSLKPRGNAKLAADGAMNVTKGAMLAQGADDALLDACFESNQLAVEAVFVPANVVQFGPARMISFSEGPYKRNFTLGQQKNRLVMRLRTQHTNENGMCPETIFGEVRAGKPHHVIVTYSPGRLCAYLNGKRVADSDKIQGDFSPWAEMHLLFGDEWRGTRDWAGSLRNLAIHSRVIGAEEAKRRYELAMKKE